jgi:hypothetical protein
MNSMKKPQSADYRRFENALSKVLSVPRTQSQALSQKQTEKQPSNNPSAKTHESGAASSK